MLKILSIFSPAGTEHNLQVIVVAQGNALRFCDLKRRRHKWPSYQLYELKEFCMETWLKEQGMGNVI